MFASTKTLCFLLFVSLFGLIGCSKSDPDTAAASIELTASKSKYVSFEIMEIASSSNLFTSGSIPATIGDVQLTMSSENNKAYVMLPRLSNGAYELRFQLNTKGYVVKFQIENKINLPAPDTYLQSANQEILSNISFVEQQIDSLLASGDPAGELAALSQDLAHYNQVLQDQVTAYNQLTLSEKADFAAFMAANQYLIDSLRVLNAPLAVSVNALRIAQQVEDHESNVNFAEKQFVKKVIRTVAHIPLLQICFQLVAVPNPIFSAGATIAAVILTTDFILDVDKTATMGKRLVKKRIKPFLLLLPATNSFLNNQETQVDIKADYRSINTTDPDNRIQNNENGPVIQRISNYYKSFKSSYEMFIGLLPSFLRPTYMIAPLPANSSSQQRNVFNNYIEISNCSNPDVTLSQIDQADGSIKLKATTALTGTQSFSYDITYLNADFTTNLKKTVNASVTNGSSCPGALGTYHVKNFFIANPGSYETAEMILMPDGVMKYRLFTESTYRTYSYIMGGCAVLFDIFGCEQGFIYVNGTTTYSHSNSCSSIYRNHIFYKQ
jgi:hypothetical protein